MRRHVRGKNATIRYFEWRYYNIICINVGRYTVRTAPGMPPYMGRSFTMFVYGPGELRSIPLCVPFGCCMINSLINLCVSPRVLQPGGDSQRESKMHSAYTPIVMSKLITVRVCLKISLVNSVLLSKYKRKSVRISSLP